MDEGADERNRAEDGENDGEPRPHVRDPSRAGVKQP
jgi:hypothetical protein